LKVNGETERYTCMLDFLVIIITYSSEKSKAITTLKTEKLYFTHVSLK
jgi:hypothetical protein